MHFALSSRTELDNANSLTGTKNMCPENLPLCPSSFSHFVFCWGKKKNCKEAPLAFKGWPAGLIAVIYLVHFCLRRPLNFSEEARPMSAQPAKQSNCEQTCPKLINSKIKVIWLRRSAPEEKSIVVQKLAVLNWKFIFCESKRARRKQTKEDSFFLTFHLCFVAVNSGLPISFNHL